MQKIEETHELGLGLTARVIYRDIGPSDCPEIGAVWGRTWDLPQVEARLLLPVRPGDRLEHALVDSQVEVLGEHTGRVWGHFDVPHRMRARSVHARSERVVDAFAEVRGQISEAIEILRGVVGARAARLAARRETIELARVGSPFEDEEL